MLLCWPKMLYPYYSLLFFPFSSFCLYGGIVGLGSSDHRVDSVIESSLGSKIMNLFIGDDNK